MENGSYWKPIGITSWVARFLHGHNCKKERAERTNGRPTADETLVLIEFWIKRVQEWCQGTKEFEKDQQRLNLKKSHRGLYECRGRIQDDYPVYLLDKSTFTEKLVLLELITGSHA